MELPKNLEEVKQETIEADILIIGGGTAGCMAAVEAREKKPKFESRHNGKGAHSAKWMLSCWHECHKCLSAPRRNA